jgi:hypothetical protein
MVGRGDGTIIYNLEVTILTTAVGSGGREEMGGMRTGSSVLLCNNQQEQEDPATSSKCINITLWKEEFSFLLYY